MNSKSLLVVAVVGAALTGALLVPSRSSGQAAGDDPAVTALINDVAAQQAVLVDNQTKIDAKLAAIGESVRLARILASRAGGRAP